MDLDSVRILYEKNANQKRLIASITKIMTALIAFEQCKNLDDEITFSETALDISSISSTIHPAAKVGETMSFMDVMYGLMLSSGNECANALAEYTYGDIGIFVEKMNERAQQIGAVNTHFTNPHGLHDENHYTTAFDLAILMQYCMKNDTFRKIAGSASCSIPATNKYGVRSYNSTNELIIPNNKNYYQYVTVILKMEK